MDPKMILLVGGGLLLLVIVGVTLWQRFGGGGLSLGTSKMGNGKCPTCGKPSKARGRDGRMYCYEHARRSIGGTKPGTSSFDE